MFYPPSGYADSVLVCEVLAEWLCVISWDVVSLDISVMVLSQSHQKNKSCISASFSKHTRCTAALVWRPAACCPLTTKIMDLHLSGGLYPHHTLLCSPMLDFSVLVFFAGFHLQVGLFCGFCSQIWFVPVFCNYLLYFGHVYWKSVFFLLCFCLRSSGTGSQPSGRSQGLRSYKNYLHILLTLKCTLSL